MKKLLSTSIILILGFHSLTAQCPDSLYITTQAQIDSFQINYPGCTEIEGYLNIGGFPGSDITDLNGLSVLTSIQGDLRIVYWDSLTSLTGLENISYIGGDLGIARGAISSLVGLENLSYIGGSFNISFISGLSSLVGLENVTTIGGNFLIYCIRISSLAGLENLTTIGGGLILTASKDLASLTGLENVTSIGGDLEIIENHDLTSMEGLEGLTSIGGSLIIGDPWYGGNFALTSLTGLENVTSIGGKLSIIRNDYLTSLKGLDNVESSTIEDLYINYNSSLSTCEVQSVCDYLANPGGSVEISYNATGCHSPEVVLDSCEAHAGIYDDICFNSKWILYPNPANQEVNISTDDGREIDEVRIYTLTGQQVMKARPEYGTVDISHLQPGMYIVEATIENTRLRQKLLVE